MKKLLSVLLVSALTVGSLTGCGLGKSDEKTIVVGATYAPHAEILKAVESVVEEQGYTLEIKEFSDYVLPNTALAGDEIDANFFQHQPYLDSYNAENNTDLVGVLDVHFEPLGIYSNKLSHLSEIQEGDTVAVPNDTTNEARALLLLEANDLIKLKEDAGINATIKDIVENPLNLEFTELDAAQIPRSLDDVTIGVVNGNYALQAGLSVADDALVTENATSVSAETYANILVVKAGNEENDKIKVLIDALSSDTCKEFIEKNYNGSVVALF